MLHRSRNMAFSSNTASLEHAALREIGRRLPAGWEGRYAATSGGDDVHAILELSAPGGQKGKCLLLARARVEPKDVPAIAERLRASRKKLPLLVVARYLSPATRERLRASDIGYLDLTGNAYAVLSKPGVFIETQGAQEDPERSERPARSLRGPKSGRLVRALVDRAKPPGVRELAEITSLDAGYVSRILAFLDSEALITRGTRGRLESVDWAALLKRWAAEAPLESRGAMHTFLEPRGLSAFLPRLKTLDQSYAITASLAAGTLAPIAPARLAVVWVADPEEAAKTLSLRPADAGANVLLLQPTDAIVFEGTRERDGLRYAAPSQVVADLLTSPGRGPAEADELIAWMQAHPKAWQS